MNFRVTNVIMLILLSITPQNNAERGWKGIIPLHSMKSDVLKVLGPPNGGSINDYRFENMNVDFIYSSKNCDFEWDVSEGTVLRIIIRITKNWSKISDIKLDLTQFERRNDIELLDVKYYENKKDGITYVAWKDEVTSIEYGPSINDNHLKCKKN